MKNDVPFSSGYFPVGIIRPWPALPKRICIKQVDVRVSVDEEIRSAWEQFLKGDARQGRPVVRCPSVPVEYLSAFLLIIEHLFLHRTLLSLHTFFDNS